MNLLSHPVLVIGYTDDIRASLASALEKSGVSAVVCESFCEAENRALQGMFCGMLVDLASMIKSKGEEKIVAYTLANFFPTLRVRSFGSALVPMAMPGSAKQDKSLNDFLTSSCKAFEPRMLRATRRHQVSLSALLMHKGLEIRTFTLNLSWGGTFLVDFNAERYAVGERVDIRFTEFDLCVQAEVRWIQPWGKRCAPGGGVVFSELDQELATIFSGILKSRKEFDRDRQIG